MNTVHTRLRTLALLITVAALVLGGSMVLAAQHTPLVSAAPHGVSHAAYTSPEAPAGGFSASVSSRASTSPQYINCLWTGNSITAGTNLGSPYTSAYEGYALNDLDAQRNPNDCLVGHYHYVGQSGWCATQALANMQSTNYHPAVDLAYVQFGEDEFADASGCRRTPAQYGTDLSTLLAYILSTSPSLTLVCFDPWEPAASTNGLGFTPQDYGTAAETACAAAGAANVVIINLTALYPSVQYHGGTFELHGDTYHPNTWANAVIGQEIVDALP